MSKSACIIELVGTPGAGKSTLAQYLKTRYPTFVLEEIPYFRRLKYSYFFTTNTIAFFPTYFAIRNSNNTPAPTRREIALMVLLEGWHKVLAKNNSRQHKNYLLDEGPICFLSRLYAFGSRSIHNESAWWEKMYRNYSETLDYIIRLDYSNEVLVDRILNRDMEQEVKEMTLQQSYDYLDQIREAQSHILFQLQKHVEHLKILNFINPEISIDKICEQIIEEL